MSTTHYRIETLRNGTVYSSHAFCAGPRQRGYAATTTLDKAAVTCTRCAKKLGITPAAKPVPTTDRGTCPCCFNNQAVTKADRIVLHGYNRPGHGYIIGRCFGVSYPRFEVSTEGTVALRNALGAHLEGVTARLADAAADRIESLDFSYTVGVDRDPVTGRFPRDERGCRLTRTVRVPVAKGTPASERDYTPNCPPQTPAFATLLAKLVAELERDRDALARDIADLTRRIDGWKPAA